MKILGRESDIINIGGQKVFPTEVENIILQIPEVQDVVVSAEPNAILGNIIKAQVLVTPHLTKEKRLTVLRSHCSKHLENFKVPQKFEFVEKIAHCRRLKKIRTTNHH
jgi:acyl-coenzyme A synthetase/AMP-(fatty) acid ligase